MSKIVIDSEQMPDIDALNKIAAFFDQIQNPYRMPELMKQWLRNYNEQHQVDTFYMHSVGYSHNALSVRWTFKKDMIEMEFCLPDGTRLMVLRLYA